jgi:hypothetical protein
MKKVTRPLEFDSIVAHRKEDCVHYAGCLTEASALLWQSFSCHECEFYTEGSMDHYCYEKASSAIAWEI